MLMSKIILQVLAFVLVVIPSSLDYFYYDKRTKHFKKLRCLLMFSAVGFLIASVYVTVNDETAKGNELESVKSELERVKAGQKRQINKIDNVDVEFGLSVPFDSGNEEVLSNYTKRILPSVENDQRRLGSISFGPYSSTSIPWISNSPLLPDLATERMAYTFLSTVGFNIEIFADPEKANSFTAEAGHDQGRGDLVFSLQRSVNGSDKADMHLEIYPGNKEFKLFSPNANLGKPIKNSGKILSIPDLAGATAILYFYPNSELAKYEKEHNVQLFNRRKLEGFGLVFSDGQKIYLRPETKTNKYGEVVYAFHFPKTIKEIEETIER